MLPVYPTFDPEKIRAYYRDPVIEWIDVSALAYPDAFNGGPLPASGYYVMPFCGHPECCRPDGPFQTIETALEWSRENQDRGERG